MQTILQDLRYAVRQTRRAPGFAVAVVLVLALGIGANAAMFTILEATLFRPLLYAHPSQLVALRTTDITGSPSESRVADIAVWQARSHTLSQIAYYNDGSAYLTSQNSARPFAEQKVDSVPSSANLFSTLGVAPALGRSFTLQEQQPGEDHVVVLSDVVWRTQFHADPKILGQSVRIDDKPYTIIGVMPRGFNFPAGESPAQIWTPAVLSASALTRSYKASMYDIIGRRRPGSSISAVEAELNSLQKQILPLYTDRIAAIMTPVRIQPIDYRRSLSATDQRTALLALLAAVAALWLIACANVACLMLARTAARRRELAIRSALGASRWRLIRQTLSESLLLSLTGGAFGLLLSDLTLRIFHHSLTTQLSPHLSLHPDARVLLALFGLSALSAILFAVIPAQLSSTVSVEEALRQDGTQAGTGRHQHRLQRVLVVSELALTLTLLVCCGLLLRTVFALRQVPLGFRTDHVFVLEPHLPGYKYTSLDPNTNVYKPLLERLKTIPGIDSAAITTLAPLDKGFNMSLSLIVSKSAYGEKGKTSEGDNIIHLNLRASGPELQRVLGFRMLKGRYFNAQDTPSSPLVAVVNQAFAREYEPLGGDVSHWTLRSGKREIHVVGIIDDFHQVGIADPAAPELDIDAAQMLPSDGFYQSTLQAHAELILRSTRDARSLIPELNHVMRQLNPDLTGTSIRTMDQIVDDAMGSQLLAAHLLETLAGLALVIALAGLYSLLAYLVTLRTRELGVRLALGAQRSHILSLVLRSAAVLLVAGVAAGVVVSIAVSRLLTRFLFGVREHDASTLVISTALLLFVGTIAAWLPARRAAAIDPMEAIRTE